VATPRTSASPRQSRRTIERIDSMVPPFPGHQVATLAERPAVDSATATAVPLLRSICWARKQSLQSRQRMSRYLAPWAVPAHKRTRRSGGTGRSAS
jgi:hypothetical protein